MEKIESRRDSAVDRNAQDPISIAGLPQKDPTCAPHLEDIPDHPLDWPMPTD